ncbi:hypothetical protein C2I36_00565 [Rhodobacteraceae bacterium WD3A24]|nr:hypothetical protein C2I36_00565 [Rhodobacteraceae bacterium WD3A24]
MGELLEFWNNLSPEAVGLAAFFVACVFIVVVGVPLARRLGERLRRSLRRRMSKRRQMTPWHRRQKQRRQRAALMKGLAVIAVLPVLVIGALLAAYLVLPERFGFVGVYMDNAREVAQSWITDERSFSTSEPRVDRRGQSSSTVTSASVRVIDGDTLELNGQRIRLHAIDAPERSQRCASADGGNWNCAAAAERRLRQLVSGSNMRCAQRDTDRYGRLVAVCYADGVDVNEVLVREGLAWAYRQYGRDYVGAERRARNEARGIWQAETMPPWEYRRR